VVGDLPDDAIVIRGGETMTVEHLRASAIGHHARCVAWHKRRCYWLSVNSVPNADLAEVAAKARRLNGKICPSTVGAIRRAGWNIVPTPRSKTAHCDVYLDDDRSVPTESALRALIAAFGAPVPNTGRPPRR
jgi:hypothetical protein